MSDQQSTPAARGPIVKLSVGAVVFRGDEVLVIRRAKPPLQNAWSIPGGKVEYGESLHDAVRREVREETGVEIDIIDLIDVFESLPSENGGDHHYVMVDYVADWSTGEPTAGDDAAAAEFVSICEAQERLSWDETRRALAVALEKRGSTRKSAAKPL